MSDKLDIQIDGDTVTVEAVPTRKRDCGMCWFSAGNRWKHCPMRCVMSTKENAKVIYRKVIEK